MVGKGEGKVRTVEHVDSVPGGVARDYAHGFRGAEQDDVFEGFFFVVEDGAAAGAGDDLEVDEVDVAGVIQISGLCKRACWALTLDATSLLLRSAAPRSRWRPAAAWPRCDC